EHVTNQAGGLVPTKMLDELLGAIPAIEDVWNIMAALVPELQLCHPFYKHPFDKAFVEEQDGSLWLGYMDVDAVPPDRLDMDEDGARDDYRTVTCTKGVCRYNLDGATYDGGTVGTKGMSKSTCD